MKDKGGSIWIGTWGRGLDKMERIISEGSSEKNARYSFIHHKPNKTNNSISSLWVIDIIESADVSLWIATNNG